MERVLEPEVMDGGEQAEAYASADFAAINQAFVDRFMARFPALRSGSVIDLGCGPADIPVRLAKALPEVTICAVDASGPMLALGRKAVGEAGLASRVELVLAYCPVDFEPPRTFDAVISNSLLHHLPDPGVLWRQIRAVAEPGASILVVDLMRPESEAQAQAIVDANAAGEPEVLRHDFFCSLLAAFELDEVRQQLRDAGLEGLTVEAISDRHLAVHGTLAISG